MEELLSAAQRKLGGLFIVLSIHWSGGLPKIEVVVAGSFDPTGPFGAKGVGEPTLVQTAAIIVNTIHHAVRVRIASLPATTERFWLASRRSARAWRRR